jgi:hypothetical protein
LDATLAAVDVGESIRSAGRCFGIPPTSLRDHIYGRSLERKRGRQGVLSNKEEAELVDYILKMQDLGWPMTIGLVRLKVAQICQDRSKPFTNGILGQGWLRWFRRRHPELTLRSSQGLEVKRARNLALKMLHLYLVIFNYSTQHILIPLITFGIVMKQEHMQVEMVEGHWFLQRRDVDQCTLSFHTNVSG